MKRIRIVGLCLVAMVAVSGAGSASALAAQEAPEFGRCIKQATKAYIYNNKGCTQLSSGDVGKYEWFPGVVNRKFTSTGNGATFKTVGNSSLIQCAGTTSTTGEYTGATTPYRLEHEVVMTFTDCETNGHACPGAVSTEKLLGILEWEKAPQHKVVLDLISEAEGADFFITFRCQLGEEIEIKGPVLVKVKAGAMELKPVRNFDETNGKQKPEKYEEPGGSNMFTSAFLTQSIVPNPFVQVGLGATTVQTNSEEVEVNWFVEPCQPYPSCL